MVIQRLMSQRAVCAAVREGLFSAVARQELGQGHFKGLFRSPPVQSASRRLNHMSNSSCDCKNIANAFAKDHLATHDWRKDLETPLYRVRAWHRRVQR
jgi:hypothetical protein